eukprot:4915561-Prymnesium_polylepis.1
MAAWGEMVPAQVTHWMFGRVGSCLGQKGATGAEGKPIWSQFCTSRCCAATAAARTARRLPNGETAFWSMRGPT